MPSENGSQTTLEFRGILTAVYLLVPLAKGLSVLIKKMRYFSVDLVAQFTIFVYSPNAV